MTFKEATEEVLTKIKKDSTQHKPSVFFLNGLKKGAAETALKEAKTLDGILAGKNDSDGKETYKKFKEASVLLFKQLRTFAEKNDGLIGVVKQYERILGIRVKPLLEKLGIVEEEEGTTQIAPPTPRDPKEVMEEFEKFVEKRKRDAEVVAQKVKDCENFLSVAGMNRQRGKDGLEVNRKLASQLVLNINQFSQGEFVKGRNALDKNISQALKTGSYDPQVVGKMRKEAAIAFDSGMRSMALVRSLVNQVVTVVQEHELEVEQGEVGTLTDDRSILLQFKKILPAVKEAESDQLPAKTEPKAWQMIDTYTKKAAEIYKSANQVDESIEYSYQTKVAETIEAFEALPAFGKRIAALLKRVILLRGKSQTPEVNETVEKLLKRVTLMAGTVKSGLFNKSYFEELRNKCDETWNELYKSLSK